MCGIAGIVETGGRRPSRRLLEAMIEAIRHRGPDETGLQIEDEVGFAHARLSILDPIGGKQPMRLPEASLMATYNGEVFNYLELREQLTRAGRSFRTGSDTEVILHSYAEHGGDCVSAFNGQWAFAIWDGRARELFLSRDRVGIAPVYYTLIDGAFVFASEIKAILRHPRVAAELDPKALDQIFTFWHTVGARTMFRGIRELPPGSCLRFKDGQIDIRRYWRPDFRPGAARLSRDDAAAQLREILVDAVRLRLRADVPVGAYLSGGLDSSAVAALVRNYTSNDLRTFSVAFEDPEFDERVFQQETAGHLGTNHSMLTCTGADIAAVFPEVVRHAEKPILRTAPAPLYLLSNLVRKHGFKVVLTGEGADEMLGGYDLFKETKIRRFWANEPDSRRRPLLLKKLYPYLPDVQSTPLAYLQKFFRVDDAALASPFFSHLPRWDTTSGLKVFYSDAIRHQLDGYDAVEELASQLPAGFETWDAFVRAQYLETSGLMAGYLLASQGDRMLMGNAVEGRFPFLDHRLMEFAGALPLAMRMRGLDEKHLLKAAVSDLLPARVVRRTKQPYRAPDATSFLDAGAEGGATDLVREFLASTRVTDYGIFRPEAVAQLVAKSERGKLRSARDNMAFVGILSTQLLAHSFIES